MISYRELAMRVVGKPLHIPGNSPRPAAHRATALALTAAMVAALASPAFAGWEIDMSEVEDDVTIEKDSSGTTTIKVGSGNTITVGDSSDQSRTDIKGVKYKDDGDDKAKDITVTGNNAGQSVPGNSLTTYEATADSQPVEVDEDTSEDMTYPGSTPSPTPSPTPVMTWPDESTDDSPAPEQPEAEAGGETDGSAETSTEGEAQTDPEDTPEDTESSPEGETTGSTDPEAGEPATQPAEGEPPVEMEGEPLPEGTETLIATLEAPAEGLPVAAASQSDEEDDKNVVTFEDPTPMQKVSAAMQNAANYVIKIINRMKNTTDEDNTLNVTLKDATIDATGTGNSALTVEGEGDTTLTLEGENELKSGTGKAALGQTGNGELTITGSGTDNKDGTLNATGGSGTLFGNDGIYTSGNLTISGGTVTATGGNSGKNTNGGAGIYSNKNLTIEGSAVVNAQGGDGKNGGDGIYGNSTVSIKDNAKIEKAQGGKGINDSGKLGTGTGGGIFGGSVSISGGTIENAKGGNFGICGDNVTVKNTANIEKAEGGITGINAYSSLSITGGTIGKWNKDGTPQDDTGAIGANGILSNGSLTISGDSKVNAKGTGNGCYGIGSYGTVEITDGTVNAEATGNSGSGISGGGTVEITGGTVNAVGTGGASSGIDSAGDLTIGSDTDNTTATVTAKGDTYGICGGTVEIKGGSDVTANGKIDGIYGSSKVFISGSTVKAEGTADAGIATSVGNDETLTISDSTVEATGKNGIYSSSVSISGDSDKTKVTAKATQDSGSGIYSLSDLTISGGTVEATATGTSGSGIASNGTVEIKGGTVNAEATGKNSVGISGNIVNIISGLIEKAKGSLAGISGGTVSITGGTIGEWNDAKKEFKAGTGAVGSIGIQSDGSLTISGDSKVKAEGTSSDGIHGGSTVEIKGGTVDAKGTGDLNSGIHSDGDVTIGGDTGTTATVNATATGDNSYGIYGSNVSVKKTATIKNAEGSEAGIYGYSKVFVTGGTIENAKGTGDSGSGIRSDGTVEIKGGTIGEWDETTQQFKVGTGAVGANGIHSDGSLTISGDSKVKATGNDGEGIFGDDSVEITGGTVTVTGTEDGIYSDSTVEIKGGNVTAEGGNAGIFSNSSLTVSDDNTVVKATATGSGSVGIGSGSTMEITGGNVTATGNNGDGIWSDGTVEITGGTVNAEATGESSVGISGNIVNIISGLIEKATGSLAGISGGSVSISGGTIGKWSEDSKSFEAGSGAVGKYGISAEGSLTISDGSKVKAKATGDSDNGISGGSVSISGDDTIVEAKATGELGVGIWSNGAMEITGGNVEANATGKYGTGIYGKAVKIEGDNTTVTSTGSNAGIYGSTVNIMGGTIENAEGMVGIYGGTSVSIGGNATVKNAKGIGDNGSGISGYSKVTISGDAVVNAEATGKNSKGISSKKGVVEITGGTTTINGGSNGGSGINSGSGTTIGGTANVIINMGAGGKALTKSTGQTTEDVDPDSARANENETLTIYDAGGNVTYPVAPSEAASSGSSAAAEAVVITPAGVSGIDFTTLQGRRVLVSADVCDTALVYTTLRSGINLHTTLGTLRQLRAQGITHITLHTLLSTTTFYLDDILAAHASEPDSTPVLVTHDGKTTRLLIGGVEQ